jgi:hypothetical protein
VDASRNLRCRLTFWIGPALRSARRESSRKRAARSPRDWFVLVVQQAADPPTTCETDDSLFEPGYVLGRQTTMGDERVTRIVAEHLVHETVQIGADVHGAIVRVRV